MGAIPFKVQRRETGKQQAKKLRRKGIVPGIFYYKGQESIPIQTEPLMLRPIVYTDAMRIIDLEVEGKEGTRECVLRDVTFDPITDKIVHFDLMGIKRGTKMQVEVPILLKGQAIGERTGGLLTHIIRKVPVSCLPKDLPESIEYDITKMKIGDSFSLKDIVVENVDFELPLESVVCSVAPPRVSTEKKPEDAPEAKAEK